MALSAKHLQGPAPARQGDRRPRRGGRGAEAAAGGRSASATIGAAQIEQVVAKMARVPVQAVSSDDRRALADARRRAEAGDLRAGRGDRRGRVGDQAVALGPALAGQADRQLPVRRPDRRRQDRAGAAAGAHPRRRVHPLRHVGVHGEARGVAADRRAARLRRLRGGRAADRRDPQVAARGAAARRDREGASGHVQHPAAGDGPRDADRLARPQGRLPPRHPDHDDQRRRARPVGSAARLRRDRQRRLVARRARAHVHARVPQPPRRHRHLQRARAPPRSSGSWTSRSTSCARWWRPRA